MNVHEKMLARSRTMPEGMDTDCIESTYAPSTSGYPQVYWEGRNRSGHTWSWIHHNGPIPEGMTVDHKCRNKLCFNVNHLRLLSNFHNGQRNHGADWPIEDGTCRNGHPESERVASSSGSHGKTHCRMCMRESRRRYKRKVAG